MSTPGPEVLAAHAKEMHALLKLFRQFASTPNFRYPPGSLHRLVELLHRMESES